MSNNSRKFDVLSLKAGDRFGRLSIGSVEWVGVGYRVHAICDCGNPVTIARSTLGCGVQSCGCLFQDRPEMNGRIKEGQPPQGRYLGLAERHRSEYSTYQKMIRRCYKQADVGYENYGGRGIAVCERWLESFANFFADMGLRPSNKHTIERENNDGNYEPGNCKWATRSEQMRNTRRTVKLTFNGVTLCAKDWANKIGINQCTITERIKRGLPIEKILSAKRVR